MKEEETVMIEFVKPKFSLGQTVYVPQKNGAKEAEVWGYHAKIWRRDDVGEPIGGVMEYEINTYVDIVRGGKYDVTGVLRAFWLFEDKVKAEEASRFLKVSLEEEKWRRVLGDWNITDFDSPYHPENREFKGCCDNIQQAHDLLDYCRECGGLIVHERDGLVEAIQACEPDVKYDSNSNVGTIFRQLEMDSFLK